MSAECNERLRMVASGVQQEVLTMAAVLCNKPSLHTANLELVLHAQMFDPFCIILIVCLPPRARALDDALAR